MGFVCNCSSYLQAVFQPMYLHTGLLLLLLLLQYLQRQRIVDGAEVMVKVTQGHGGHGGVVTHRGLGGGAQVALVVVGRGCVGLWGEKLRVGAGVRRGVWHSAWKEK